MTWNLLRHNFNSWFNSKYWYVYFPPSIGLELCTYQKILGNNEFYQTFCISNHLSTYLVYNISLLYFYIFVLKNSIFLLHICICFIQDVIYLEELKWIHISYLAPHSALLKVSTGKKLHLSKDLWINCLVMANTGSALKYSILVELAEKTH